MRGVIWRARSATAATAVGVKDPPDVTDQISSNPPAEKPVGFLFSHGSGEPTAKPMDETQSSLRENLRALPRGAWILFFGTFLNKFGTFVLPLDRKSTRLNSSHVSESRMPS